jgi:crotonobetainyl-CoA:carnitine CoA-transferase CaiB-like acyl-CoA transferase
VFCPVPLGAAGAGLAAAVGALARVYERGVDGRGGWVETSLYDGLLALLPMIVGRVEHDSPSTTLLWREQGPTAALTYRCADGEYLQLWFGAKGAYEAFLAHIGDPPSEAGYTADTVSGAMAERTARWAERLATRPRAHWLDHFAGQPFRCEPVLRPGEALADPHVREVGLSVDVDDPERGPITVLGPVARVAPSGTGPGDGEGGGDGAGPLLSGVRVLDLSAYLAGPVTPQILAELGADVVKVEPATGDVHRTMEPLFAAGQRGKRALALDLKHPEAAGVLERLFRWSDVVHHNSRVGLDARLGYDEAAVRAVQPSVVYSYASGFGTSGPRATQAANDHLMQALSGVETAMGGVGAPPTMTNWGAIDVTGGWLSAVAVLAGLCARRRTGRGQTVSTSLLGAGLLLTSGAFLAGGERVEAPVVAADQTGYGAAYRVYSGADGAWFAMVVPDQMTWTRLRDALASAELSERLPALRTAGGEAHPDEGRLVDTFATKDAATWVGVLRTAGVPVEPVLEADRSAFVARLLDDPVNRQLGRVAAYTWDDRGRLEQPNFPLRTGPAPRPAPRAALPRLGEHTTEVLTEVGLDQDVRARLVDAGVVTAAPASVGAVAGRRAPSV